MKPQDSPQTNMVSDVQSDAPVRTNYHTHDGVNSPLVNKEANGIINVFTGAGTPTATSTVPKMLGDMYVDTTNRKLYFATLISNPPAVGDFTIVN